MAYDEGDRWLQGCWAGLSAVSREEWRDSYERQDALLREAVASGDFPKVMGEFQSRIDRQRRELDRLQARVVRQRNLLRRIHELGRDLNDSERGSAEAQLDESSRKLIADELGLPFWK